MSKLLIYFISSSLSLAVFMLVYLTFLRNNTRYNLCRFYLISSILLSFLIPSMPLDLGISLLDAEMKVHTIQLGELQAGTVVSENTLTDVPLIIDIIRNVDPLKFSLAVVLTVSLILLIRFFYRFGYIYLIQKKGKRDRYNETNLIYTDKTDNAFSFLGYIFINPLKFTDEEKRLIILHEYEHIRHLHSIDLILTELLIVFQWFNPFVYTLRRNLIEIHELIADDGVIRRGADPYSYQNLLLNVVTSSNLPGAGNQLSAFITKKRIAMIGQKTKPRGKWINFLILIPVSTILVVGVSAFSLKTINSNQKDETIDLSSDQNMRSDQKSLYERAEKEIGNETFLKDFYTDFTSGNSFKFSVVLKKECIYGLHFVSKNSSDKIHVLLEKGNKDGLTVESEMDFSFKGKTTISPKETKAYTIAIQNSSIGKTEVMAVLTLKHMKEVTGNKSDEFTRQDTLKVKKEKTNNSSTNDEVFMIVEEMPSFGDGSNEAFGRFVAENLNYPDEAVKKGIHGKVFVQFIVEVDGSISNVKVLRSVNPMLDIEAVRVVQSSPKWNPGRQKGKTVRVTYTMPINFTLEKVKVENKSEKIENEVFLVVEEMPEFIGGQEALGKFITENLVYPQQAAEDSIQGKVFIEFVINEEGELKDHKVLRGVHPILDEEALRVMKLSPKWKPGKQRGKTVSVKFTLPITFALH